MGISFVCSRCSDIIRVIDEFARNTRTTNGCATPSSFLIFHRNAKRFVTELRAYKGEVNEPREKLVRRNGGWGGEGDRFFPAAMKKRRFGESGYGIKPSDRICVSLWRGRRESSKEWRWRSGCWRFVKDVFRLFVSAADLLLHHWRWVLISRFSDGLRYNFV